jgi:putative Holliday junction resolvase
MSEESSVITLVDEEGNEHRFDLINVVELDENRYAVMVPEATAVENAEEDEEAVIFRIETDDEGEEILVDIEDDEEFERVCDYLDQLMDEEEETDDENK